MLTSLKFVQGAISKNEVLPALSHFIIDNGFITGFNGSLALCSPIPLDIRCQPKASQLIKTIAACDETIQLAMTPAGRLSVKSGKFKAFVECLPIDELAQKVYPEGDFVPVNGVKLLKALKTANAFTCADKNPLRSWSAGVFLKDGLALATDNVTMIECVSGFNYAEPLNIPREAVKELLRIGEEPTSLQVSANSVTFHFSGDRWLRTQLLDVYFPDVSRILGRACSTETIDSEIFDALKVLAPFVDKDVARIIFTASGLSTHLNESEGAQYEIAGFSKVGSYRLDLLRRLEGVCETIDWSGYPDKPALFFGDGLRGAIMGMKWPNK